MAPQEEPHGDWARHASRSTRLSTTTCGASGRVRPLMPFGRSKTGHVLGIRTSADDYRVSGCLACPLAQTTILASTPTRLKRLDDVMEERLINWGYAICDAAMRKHVTDDANAPPPLLAAASDEGAIVVSIVVSPCRFIENTAISGFEAEAPTRPTVRDQHARARDGILCRPGRCGGRPSAVSQGPQLSPGRRPLVRYFQFLGAARRQRLWGGRHPFYAGARAHALC
jgi:hypothetical protein